MVSTDSQNFESNKLMTFHNTNSGFVQSQVMTQGSPQKLAEDTNKNSAKIEPVNYLPEMQVPPNTNNDINMFQFNSNVNAINPTMMNDFENLQMKIKQNSTENRNSLVNSKDSNTEQDHPNKIRSKNVSEINEDQSLYKMMFKSNPTNEFCEPKDDFGFGLNMSGIVNTNNNDMSNILDNNELDNFMNIQEDNIVRNELAQSHQNLRNKVEENFEQNI